MNFLLEHARNEVWCEPRQDFYHVFKPWRVSPRLGAIGRVVIEWYRINLPTPNKDRYHVYNIGKIADRLIGITLERGTWVSVADLMVNNESLLEVYLTNGTMVPKAMCFLSILKDYTVVLAVRIEPVDFGQYQYVDGYVDGASSLSYQINTRDLYIRFYHNMRFNTPDWVDVAGDPIQPIRHITRTIVNLADWTWFNASVSIIKTKFGNIGAGLFFRDGFVETLPTVYSASFLGKTLSYTYDDSIKSVQFHKLNGLKSFDSILDEGKAKYILMSSQDYGTIDYLDDVDFYIVKRDPVTNAYRGVILNRYMKDAVRMITHNTWSINCDYVLSLINDHGWSNALEQIEVLAVIRQGALIRGLVHQNNRIEELYKLPRAKRLAIMSGQIDSVPEWHASVLEDSDYAKLMGCNIDDITVPLVMGAYGYNSVSQIGEPILYSPVDDGTGRIVNTDKVHLLPNPQGTGDRAIFCYNEDRELIHRYGNDALDVVEILPTPEADGSKLVEIFHARISEDVDGTFFDQDVISEDLRYWGFRCYVCPIINGIPSEDWVDVTGGPYYAYSTASTPTVSWNWGLLNGANMFPAVRINGIIHVYDATMPASDADYDGVLKFTVGSTNPWFGDTAVRAKTLAPAVCNIFMDGRLLIRDLDYYMNWPEFTIVRRPEKPIEETKVTIRTYGCCDKVTMKPHQAREFGFVKGGSLSVNGRYDVRNDRNVHVNIAGRLYKPEELLFAEDGLGGIVTDGLPYVVEDYITPIEPYTGFDTVVERAKSFAIDDKVENYLSLQLSENDPGDHTVVFERWRVFSPFLNAIIHEMLFGNFFNDILLNVRYGNIEVENWISSYKGLLDYDPCVIGFDEQYVIVYPHLYLEPVEISTTQFTFLQYLIRNYLNSRVELSQSVNIGS